MSAITKLEPEKPDLSRAVFTFVQPGNTQGTTAEYEILEISAESSTGKLPDGFMVFKTTTGWSFDSPQDLLEILKRVDEGQRV